MDAVSDGAGVRFDEQEVPWGDALRTPFAALAAGDVDALETVWEIAGGRVYAIALWRTGNAEDARDVVQDVFVRLASRQRGLEEVEAPGPWLLAVAHRVAVDATRRRRVRTTESLASADLVAASSSPERAAEVADLSRALAGVPAPQREAVSLRHLAGHSFREIAAITGVPTFTAASRCRLGLARLRRLLERSS